jgi:exodeoxyribonuclease-3
MKAVDDGREGMVATRGRHAEPGEETIRDRRHRSVNLAIACHRQPRSMRIITFNANGIRSAANKGFFNWLRKQEADVVCLQETKSQEDQLGDPTFRPDGHHCFYRDAVTKKGYSGVAIYSRREPDEVRTGLGWNAFDDEGRYLEARFGNLSVVSLYVPSGSSGEERQRFKFKVMEWMRPILDEWLRSGRDYVLCGDWNIVRARNDIKNWTSNQKNSGCLPRERAWLNGLIADTHGDGSPQPKHGWQDAFRLAKPDLVEYTWWSNRGAARANNVGWRIDYQIITPSLRDRVRDCTITPSPRFSDHAPLLVEYA